MAGHGHGDHGGGGGGGGGGGPQGSGQMSLLWNGLAGIAGVWLVLTGIYFVDSHPRLLQAIVIVTCATIFLAFPYGVHRLLWTAPFIPEWYWTRIGARSTAILCVAVGFAYVWWCTTIQMWGGSNRSHLPDHMQAAAFVSIGICLLLHVFNTQAIERFLHWRSIGWHSIGIGHAPHPEGDEKHDDKHAPGAPAHA